MFTTHSPVLCHVIVRDTEYTENIHSVDPMLRQMHRPNIPGTSNRCRKESSSPALKALECELNSSSSEFCSLSCLALLRDLCASSEAGGEINVSAISHHATCSLRQLFYSTNQLFSKEVRYA